MRWKGNWFSCKLQRSNSQKNLGSNFIINIMSQHGKERWFFRCAYKQPSYLFYLAKICEVNKSTQHVESSHVKHLKSISCFHFACLKEKISLWVVQNICCNFTLRNNFFNTSTYILFFRLIPFLILTYLST